MAFELNKTLEGDTAFVLDLPLCRVLLMNDSRFPWLILVPRKEGAREIFDLNKEERAVLIEEINHCAQVLQKDTGAFKTNVATLGNVVSQMHIHVIAREQEDDAWPKPVWGTGTKVLYEKDKLSQTIEHLRKIL